MLAWAALLVPGCLIGAEPVPYGRPGECVHPPLDPAGDRWIVLGTNTDTICPLEDGDTVRIEQGGQGALMVVVGVRFAAPIAACSPSARDVRLTVDCGAAHSTGDQGCPGEGASGAHEFHDVFLPFRAAPPAEMDCSVTVDRAPDVHLETRRHLRVGL